MPYNEVRYATLSRPYTKEEYQKFIKLCVKLTKSSDVYKAYCEDLAAGSGKFVHHGPIFSLTDICEILTEWHLAKDEVASSTDVVDSVILEHQANRVEVMLVDTTEHRVLSMNSSFVDMKQLITKIGVNGYLDLFIDRYLSVIPPNLKAKYNTYFKSIGIEKEMI